MVITGLRFGKENFGGNFYKNFDKNIHENLDENSDKKLNQKFFGRELIQTKIWTGISKNLESRPNILKVPKIVQTF